MMVNKASMVGGPLAVALPNIADGLRRHRFALLAALVLNIGDLLSTHVGLANGLPEGNLIPAMLHANGGEVAMLGAKVAVVALVALIVCLLGRRYPRLWHTFTVTNVVILAAVLSNSAQILAR